MVITVALTICSAVRIDKSVDRYAETVLKNAVYRRVNDSIHAYINSNLGMFRDIVSHQYDQSGNLVCINISSGALNGIQIGLEKEILSTVSKIEKEDYYISTGNLSGIKLFADSGPKIKMKIVPLGTITCDTINEFNSVGINHTLHKVGFCFNISFHAAAPYQGTAFETKHTVTVCETVIIGQVPSVYLN